MDAADFVLGTLSHYVTCSDGPPPGVPSHAGANFETRVASICVDQRVTPIVSRSLDMLALPPAISSVTAVRLKRHGEASMAQAGRRMRTLEGVLDAFTSADIDALVAGEALAAATLYGDDGVRAIDRLELVVDGSRVPDAIAAAKSAGFLPPGVDPPYTTGDPIERAEPRGARERAVVRANARRRTREVVAYHHYIAPLLLWNRGGDCLRLRARAVDLGRPDDSDSGAWERARTITSICRAARGLSLVDQLVELAVCVGVSGFADLARATDVGRLLNRHAADVDWGCVDRIARADGLQSAVSHALRRTCRSLGLPESSVALEPPPAAYERWINLVWRHAGFDGVPRAGWGRRFFYGLAACGGPFSKARWAWGHAVPRARWVEQLVGDTSNPRNWVEFHRVARDGMRGGAGPAPHATRRPNTDNIEPLDRREP